MDGPDSEDEDRELVLQRRVPGQRPTWIRDDEMWDEDFPDLGLNSNNPPSGAGGKELSSPSSKLPPASASGAGGASGEGGGEGVSGGGVGGGKEDAALMRKPQAPAAADRLQDEFLREVEQLGSGGVGAGNGTVGVDVGEGVGAPPALMAEGGEGGKVEDETFYSIGGGGNASDIGIIAYELVGTNEPLPGLPDVKFRRCVCCVACVCVCVWFHACGICSSRFSLTDYVKTTNRIRRKELNPDESFQRALGAIQVKHMLLPSVGG